MIGILSETELSAEPIRIGQGTRLKKQVLEGDLHGCYGNMVVVVVIVFVAELLSEVLSKKYLYEF